MMSLWIYDEQCDTRHVYENVTLDLQSAAHVCPIPSHSSLICDVAAAADRILFTYVLVSLLLTKVPDQWPWYIFIQERRMAQIGGK